MSKLKSRTIPQAIRRKLHVVPGTCPSLVEDGGAASFFVGRGSVFRCVLRLECRDAAYFFLIFLDFDFS